MYQDAPLEEVVKKQNVRHVTFSIWVRGPVTAEGGSSRPTRSMLLLLDSQRYETIPSLCQDVADLMRLHASLLEQGWTMRFVVDVSH